MTNLIISVWYLYSLAHPLPVAQHEPWKCCYRGTNFVIEQWDVPDMPKPTVAELSSAYTAATNWYPTTFPDPSDYDLWQDDRMKATIKALIKVINLRLPAGQKITAAELKQAIKDKL